LHNIATSYSDKHLNVKWGLLNWTNAQFSTSSLTLVTFLGITQNKPVACPRATVWKPLP